MSDQQEQTKAANVLQRRFRSYQGKREQAGLNLSKADGPAKEEGKQDAGKSPQDQSSLHDSNMGTNERLSSAMTSQKLEQTSQDTAAGKNDPATRWQRSGFLAGRLAEGPSGAGQDPDEGQKPKSQTDAKLIKAMEAQYWLEMVDKKHRYGSNLKYYHQRWNQSDTKEPFFKWLDEGEGKEVDLAPDCSREQLDKEQITYLSAEQRRNYLIKVRDGKLVWARNGKPLDTAKGKHKDGGNGRGIIDDAPTGAEPDSDSSSSSSAYSSGSSEKDGKTTKDKPHYSSKDPDTSSRKYYTSPKAIFDVLLRKTTKQNTWIYVMAAGSNNLYVGMKTTGSFQHSSFLYGAKVASAGLLKARDGYLYSLSPLSGHYRAGTEHFKNFVAHLEDAGVDMSHVSVSKSLMMIGAIEKYGKATKKRKQIKQDLLKKLNITSKEEQAKKAEAAENDRITREAQKKEEEARMTMGDTPGGEQKKRGTQEERLPYEGKDASQLDEKQKYERGIALMRKAMARGFPNKEGEAPTKEAAEASKLEQQLQKGTAPGQRRSKDSSAAHGEQEDKSAADTEQKVGDDQA